MGAKLIVIIDTPSETAATLAARFDRGEPWVVMKELQHYLSSVAGRTRHALIRTCVSGVAASQTVTCAQAAAVDATDTITIAGTALAVVASPSTTAQFAKGASDAAMATNLANCINGNATLAKLVYAEAADAVVTIRAKVPGPIGNLITLAEVGSGMVLTGAALAAGASDEFDAMEFGHEGD